MLSQKTSGTHEREAGKGMSNPAGTRQEHPWRALHQKFMAQSRPERSQESSRPLIHISRLQNWTAELLQGLGGWSPAEGSKHNQGLAFWKTSFTINLEEKKQEQFSCRMKWMTRGNEWNYSCIPQCSLCKEKSMGHLRTNNKIDTGPCHLRYPICWETKHEKILLQEPSNLYQST